MGPPPGAGGRGGRRRGGQEVVLAVDGAERVVGVCQEEAPGAGGRTAHSPQKRIADHPLFGGGRSDAVGRTLLVPGYTPCKHLEGTSSTRMQTRPYFGSPRMGLGSREGPVVATCWATWLEAPGGAAVAATALDLRGGGVEARPEGPGAAAGGQGEGHGGQPVPHPEVRVERGVVGRRRGPPSPPPPPGAKGHGGGGGLSMGLSLRSPVMGVAGRGAFSGRGTQGDHRRPQDRRNESGGIRESSGDEVKKGGRHSHLYVKYLVGRRSE